MVGLGRNVRWVCEIEGSNSTTMKKSNEIEELDRQYNDEEATVGMCENGGFLNEYNSSY